MVICHCVLMKQITYKLITRVYVFSRHVPEVCTLCDIATHRLHGEETSRSLSPVLRRDGYRDERREFTERSRTLQRSSSCRSPARTENRVSRERQAGCSPSLSVEGSSCLTLSFNWSIIFLQGCSQRVPLINLGNRVNSL